MQKKDKPEKEKPSIFMIIVFLLFAAFTVWFFYSDQAIVGVIFAFISFVFLRRILDF